MKNLVKNFVIILFALIIGLSLTACQEEEKEKEKENNQNPGVWVDPCTQTTQLTGGTVLSTGGGNQNLSGSPYGYEIFMYAGGGGSMTWYGANKGGGGAYKAAWTGYYLARLGYFWGNGGPYTQYKNIYVDFNFKRTNNASGANGGMIGIYGWSRNPSASVAADRLIEYYIVDDWFYTGQMGINNVDNPNGTRKQLGTYTVDGTKYTLFYTTRTDQSIDGTKTFAQIVSVRQGQRTAGTISVTEHFKEWSKLNVTLGNMYEVKFKVEVFGGNGNLDLSYLYLSQETNPRPADKICNGNCGSSGNNGGNNGGNSGGTIYTGTWKGLIIPAKNTAHQHTSYQGKSDVLQVTPGDNWSVLEYSLNSFSNQAVKITVSMDVWLTTASKVAWQVNNDGYPVILGNTTTNLAAGQWHSLSVTNAPITPETNKTLYLSKDQLGNNNIYIANFTIDVTP